jgi:hypothetical protein
MSLSDLMHSFVDACWAQLLDIEQEFFPWVISTALGVSAEHSSWAWSI